MPHLREIIVHILIGIPDIMFCTYVYNYVNIEQEQEQELYLPRHRLVEAEAILPLTLQTNLILLAVGQF